MASNKRDIAVIGIGKFGQSVVEQLVDLKRFVLAIDSQENRLVQVSRITKTAIADAADIESLKNLGLSKFKTVIVSASDNIEIVAALTELGVKHIIAKAKSMRHERVLSQIGVDVIVRPEAEAGVRTALIAANPNFIKYSELLQEIGDGYAIGGSIVTDKKWLNKPIKDLRFQMLKVSVVSIKRGTKVILPSGDQKIKLGDIVTIIGKIPAVTKTFGELNDETIHTQAIKIERVKKANRAAKIIKK